MKHKTHITTPQCSNTQIDTKLQTDLGHTTWALISLSFYIQSSKVQIEQPPVAPLRAPLLHGQCILKDTFGRSLHIRGI